ncbi:MAG: SPOR domain-containing protein [Saprospiraceae bacterium]|nr:SPOR domain-containing protein [Saprospiraceae bacterium]
MGRLIRIGIYALIIFILYFLVSVIIKSYYKTNLNGEDQTTNNDTTTYDSVTVYPSDTNQLTDSPPISNEDIVDGIIDYSDVDTKVKELEEKKKTALATSSDSKKTAENRPAQKPKSDIIDEVKEIKPNQVTKKSSSRGASSGNGGDYLVMAGSYLLKINADKMVKKLQTMGYTKADVIIFPTSEFHSVIAARFSSETTAKKEAESLKNKGIDSFVKRK